MLKIKPFVVAVVLLVALTLLVPTILVLPFTEEASGKLGEDLKPAEQPTAKSSADAAVEVAVYRMAKSKLEKLQLNEYLIGVVAAEMPAEFETEALKAQALAARTYFVQQMLGKEKAKLPEGAQVTDTEAFQVYKSTDELKKIWGANYKWKIEKISEAVAATDGQILTFEGAPITATFFSTSNGFTENSEEYWPNSFPYLRSVESPWDLKSPKFNDQKIVSIKEFESKLGVKLTDLSNIGKVVSRTAGKRVGKVEINGKVLTGKEIREKLSLKSSDFTWSLKGDNIVITTKGFGHGVGLSQYGANGMATEGKTYQEIVKHYYSGVEISQADSLLTKVTAQK
ncbi:stage II sporulation protein D [Bacillus sp. T33-2]|uniref:stage II sporulation protein D n=1 Tax=Bacillus sp. T33-2 TaxID=2054168 RepID=UPI000C75A22E|nr:stage II sporulation protein D [Bacillus sp. T33-2]PLR94494.1 stage II sporulation protein D [Bacillus sp. T33-2]